MLPQPLNTFARHEADGYAVYSDSLLFRAGTFPERKDKAGNPLVITTDHLDLAVTNFDGPLGGNVQHTKWLDGRAVQLTSLRRDGDTLRGETRIPLPLDGLLTDDERKISVEWNPATFDRLDGLCLCTNPRINDAACMTAFTDYVATAPTDTDRAERTAQVASYFAKPVHNTPQGQNLMQMLHDMSAPYAVCIEPDGEGKGKMSSKHELAGAQAIHDMTLTHGAKCPSLTAVTSHAPAYYPGWMTGKDTPMNDSEKHSLFTSVVDGLKKLCGIDTTTQTTATTPAAPANFSKEQAEMNQRLADMETKFADERKKAVEEANAQIMGMYASQGKFTADQLANETALRLANPEAYDAAFAVRPALARMSAPLIDAAQFAASVLPADESQRMIDSAYKEAVAYAHQMNGDKPKEN